MYINQLRIISACIFTGTLFFGGNMKNKIYIFTLMVLSVVLAISTYFIVTNRIENEKQEILRCIKSKISKLAGEK